MIAGRSKLEQIIKPCQLNIRSGSSLHTSQDSQAAEAEGEQELVGIMG